MAPLSLAVSLARDLVRLPSVTPAAGDAFDLAADVLAAAGFRVERPVFEEPGTAPVENLYARIGERAPHLAFAGHLDVVPPGDAGRWRHDPFSGAIDDGCLHGRGTVDMKGGIAAFMAAGLAFLERRGGTFDGSLSFLLTGDEEGPSVNGTRKLIDWCAARGERFDAAVVGEPTCVERLGDTVKIGRRGSLSGTIVVGGRQGHVAYPHRAANPLPVAAAVAAALTEPPLDGGSAHFAASNLELVSIDTGNPAWNVIPGEATLRFNIRYNDLWSRDRLAAEIARRANAVPRPVDVTIDLKVEPGYGDVFLTEPGPLVEAMAGAIEAATGRAPELSTGGGTSDARFIKDVCPVIEFGLVGTTMHQTDERAPIAEIDALAAIYGGFLDRYFGG